MGVLVFRDGQVQSVAPRLPQEGEVVWLHLQQPSDDEIQRLLGELFHCHPLVVEDVMHFGQRAKVDHYPHADHPHALVSFYSVSKNLEAVEFLMVLGHDFLITVAREAVPELEDVYRRHEQHPDGGESPGRLVYEIVDRCVDAYASSIDRLEERLDALERRVFDRPDSRVAGIIFRLKRIVGRLRRIAADARNVVGMLAHEAFPYTDEHDSVYFVDVYDHATRVVDALDAIRDNLSGLLDLQTAQRSNRMNEIMKTLTVISTVFLPLNFIVGLYGMNFEYMPELHWRYGYAYVWALLLGVTAAMGAYFKRRGWW